MKVKHHPPTDAERRRWRLDGADVARQDRLAGVCCALVPPGLLSVAWADWLAGYQAEAAKTTTPTVPTRPAAAAFVGTLRAAASRRGPGGSLCLDDPAALESAAKAAAATATGGAP